jgi:small subunit ribosomal protein S6
MLYELIAIVSLNPPHTSSNTNKLQVRPGNLLEVKEYAPLPPTSPSRLTQCRIARTTGSLILNSGGTIRGIKNWGVFSLPKRTRKHQAQYTDGHYFIMRYDASSKIQDDVRKTLGLDPRMIKFSSVKLGDGTLESLSKIGGQIPWDTREQF